jgi:hypothetical protein
MGKRKGSESILCFVCPNSHGSGTPQGLNPLAQGCNEVSFTNFIATLGNYPLIKRRPSGTH